MQQLASAAVFAAEKKTVNPIIPNGTFIVELIAFFLILWFLYRKVVPLISSSMAKRQELIRSQIEDSRAAKERLEAAEAEYKQAVADTRTDAARIREEARVQGQQIIEEMRAKAQEEAARIAAANEARLETEHQLVLVQLRSEVGELAVELASRIVGHELSGDARQRQLIDDFINDLDAAPAPSVAGS
ncbi:MAG TPA: F0F1 ATP synthase subunit B [Frankiaceae bacterium]|nr:F0F1 ATP synthase subunit B [Frankiaceae bacterium]